MFSCSFHFPHDFFVEKLVFLIIGDSSRNQILFPRLVIVAVCLVTFLDYLAKVFLSCAVMEISAQLGNDFTEIFSHAFKQ